MHPQEESVDGSTPTTGSFARRVQDYLLHAAQVGREVVSVPPFVVTIDPGTDLRYLNYAIPVTRPVGEDAIAAVRGLRAAMHEHARLPRLEFVAQANDGLDEILLTAGLEQESSLPLMTCAPQELKAAPPVAGLRIETLRPDSPDELLLGVRSAQEEAFGQSVGAGSGTTRQREFLRAGGTSVAAIVDGPVVGGASGTPVANALSEVAGVGVRTAYRRRGIAAALTAAAARQVFRAKADLALLTPGHDDAQRIYERAGFTGRLTMRAYAEPQDQRPR